MIQHSIYAHYYFSRALQEPAFWHPKSYTEKSKNDMLKNCYCAYDNIIMYLCQTNAP